MNYYPIIIHITRGISPELKERMLTDPNYEPPIPMDALQKWIRITQGNYKLKKLTFLYPPTQVTQQSYILAKAGFLAPIEPITPQYPTPPLFPMDIMVLESVDTGVGGALILVYRYNASNLQNKQIDLMIESIELYPFP